MSLEFELRHAKHAIGEFTASMQFQTSLNEAQFAPVSAALRLAAEKFDLPALAPLKVFRLGAPPPGIEAPAGPISYQRFAKDGSVSAALLCDDDTITFTLREYTRWHEIADTLRDIFAELASVYLPQAAAIKVVKLQYLNEFRAKSPGTAPSSELFRGDSRWIAPFAKSIEDFWHCHVGAFVPAREDMRHLVNVNCDVMTAKFPPDNADRRYVKVLVLAGCNYDIGSPLALTGAQLAKTLEEDLRAAHALERATLAEVISDPYLEVMGALNHDY